MVLLGYFPDSDGAIPTIQLFYSRIQFADSDILNFRPENCRRRCQKEFKVTYCHVLKTFSKHFSCVLVST